MSNAVSPWEKLAYGKESNWGVTPTGAAASQYLRFTSVNSNNQKDTVESAEVVNSAEVGDIIQVKQRGGLSFGSELSYGNLDDLLESIFWNPWTTNVLQPGTTRRSLTFERQFTDINRWWSYPGAFVSQLNLQFSIGRIITASVTAMSKPLVDGGSSAFTGGSTVAAPSNGVMDPITSLQMAQEGGAGSIAGLTELNLSITRNIIDLEQIGSTLPLDMLPGQLVVTGSFSCYLADATYIAKHLSHATSSLSFTLGGVSNLKLNFLMSKLKLTVPDAPNTGPNAPIIQTVSFKAFKDATNGTLKITRTP